MGDHSCYVAIVNSLSSQPLKRKGTPLKPSFGDWAIQPPDQITAGQTVNFRVADYALRTSGSAASVKYVIEATADMDEVELEFKFSCGFTDNNYVHVNNSHREIYAVTYTASAGGESFYNHCPPKGNPVNVTFTVSTIFLP